MKTFVSRCFLVAVVAASAAAFFWVRAAGGDLELTVLIATVATLLCALALERWMPFRGGWNRSQGDLTTDLASAAVLVGVVDPLLKYGAPLALVVAYGHASSAGAGWVPADTPFAFQLVGATLLIEFGRYWSHRAHHAFKPLWWLHAMHHSSERLYALNNLRFHPLNHAINFAIGVIPAMLLGFSPEALLGYLAISQPVLMLQHANIELKCGWANYVFSSNEVHRWHHSSAPEEANSNFGNALLIWDHVFSTFRYSPQGNAPREVGLFGASAAYPARGGYFAQLRSMLAPPCCVA